MFGFVIAAVAASASPSPVPSASADADAYRIYAAAMRALETLDQPAFIDDTERRITTATVPGSGDVLSTDDRTDRALFDSMQRREVVFAEPGDREVVIGPSYFAPDTWLLARQQRPAPQPSVPDVLPDLSDLKVIADVTAASSPSYDVRLAERNGAIAHLVLHPRKDPVKHNLRELWIDTTTSRILRAIVQGTYRPMPGEVLETSFALEDFGQVGPYWLVIHRKWTWAPPFSGVLLHFEATVQTMRFPQTLPAWVFDERAFRAHAGDLRDVLGPSPSPSPATP